MSHSRRYNRRHFLHKTGALLLSAPFFAPCSSSAASTAVLPNTPKTINIGTFGPSHCATSFVYSKLRGSFQRESLNVNLINYSSMSMIARDLINGSLDFGQLIVPLVFAIHTGLAPFKGKMPLAVTQIAGTNGAALISRKGLDISSPLDFEGKSMANHSKLSVHYLINMMFLESYGLNYKDDIDFRVIKLDECVDVMGKGEIDSFVMPEPNNAVAEMREVGNVYMFSKYIWPNHPCCALVTRQDLLEKEKNMVTDVTRVITESALLANNPATREETVDLLRSTSEYKYDSIPRATLLKAFTPGRSDFYPFPYRSAAMLIVNIMKKYDLLQGEIDTARVASKVFQSGLSRKIMLELGTSPPETDFRIEKVLGKLHEFSV